MWSCERTKQNNVSRLNCCRWILKIFCVRIRKQNPNKGWHLQTHIQHSLLTTYFHYVLHFLSNFLCLHQTLACGSDPVSTQVPYLSASLPLHSSPNRDTLGSCIDGYILVQTLLLCCEDTTAQSVPMSRSGEECNDGEREH